MIQLPTGGKKLFVLDTNVILHDGECFLNFEEHDIVIPMVVLEELDKFKKGNENRNLQARRFLRKVDEYSNDVLSEDGMDLGEGCGRLWIVLTDQLNQKLGRAFLQDCPDHRILNTALRHPCIRSRYALRGRPILYNLALLLALLDLLFSGRRC